MTKTSITKQFGTWYLDIEIYLIIGAWFLEFVIVTA
jgi:hypothetical protein